jgi:hypothetical protein
MPAALHYRLGLPQYGVLNEFQTPEFDNKSEIVSAAFDHLQHRSPWPSTRDNRDH